MTSERQREANRRNSERSTGPRTSEGKAISSQNALRHGVLSEKATSVNEDAELFQELLVGLTHEFDPRSPLEALLVERLANLFWRERRLSITEVRQLNHLADNATNHVPRSDAALTIPLIDQLLIGRYQTMLTNQINVTIAQITNLKSRELLDD